MGIFNTINEIKIIDFQAIHSSDALMEVFNNVSSFFHVKRIFSVKNNLINCSRGHHAHKKCEQIITCPYGAIRFKVDDGDNKKTYLIEENKYGVYIPNHIWTETTYIKKNTVLICYCSEEYDEKSYIRNYDDFIKFRKN